MFFCIDLFFLYDICFWVVCLVVFFLFFRKLNFLVLLWGYFDFNKYLCCFNIKFGVDGVIIIVYWFKII